MNETKSAPRKLGAKEVILNKTELRVQKTIAYLESERGKENWLLNVGYGFDDEKNLFAAVQIATHLIKYENIIEVLEIVRSRIKSAKAA